MNTDGETEQSEKKQENTIKISSTPQTPNTKPLESKVFSEISGFEPSSVPAKRSPEIKTVNLQEFLASQKNMKFDFSPTKSPTRINHPTRKTITKPESPSKTKAPPKTKVKTARSPNGYELRYILQRQ
ncbi:uncharacterized protein VTP21DRAFT_5831 [Calcarisporiella thermophila]|uniref:uncharacterized protein n=1 Tax=Calcarisporiella thermophila TaxID=911321 RepID=UPI0037447BB2